jgi:hypothetical protein
LVTAKTVCSFAETNDALSQLPYAELHIGYITLWCINDEDPTSLVCSQLLLYLYLHPLAMRLRRGENRAGLLSTVER